MWRVFVNAVRSLLVIQDMVERHERDINELRQELRRVSGALEELRHEMRLRLDNERHEREKFFLRVGNALLNFERHQSLPAAGRKRKKRR